MPLKAFHYTQVAKAVEDYDSQLSKIVQTQETTKVVNAQDKSIEITKRVVSTRTL